jgi:hypothetical protein
MADKADQLCLSAHSQIRLTGDHSCFQGMAIVDHPTASWQAMQEGNVFYRRQQCYSIPGKLPELADYIIAGCRYGGPIGNVNSRGSLFWC